MAKKLTSINIIKGLESHSVEIHKFSVKKIGLFGSYLRKPTKKSDIDFLVTFEKSTFDNYMGLKFLLERLFHKKVDIVIEEDLKPALEYVKEGAVYATT